MMSVFIHSLSVAGSAPLQLVTPFWDVGFWWPVYPVLLFQWVRLFGSAGAEGTDKPRQRWTDASDHMLINASFLNVLDGHLNHILLKVFRTFGVGFSYNQFSVVIRIISIVQLVLLTNNSRIRHAYKKNLPNNKMILFESVLDYMMFSLWLYFHLELW